MTHDPSPKQMTNNQLAEAIRAHIIAMRGEMTRQYEDLERQLNRIEAKIDRANREEHQRENQ